VLGLWLIFWLGNVATVLVGVAVIGLAVVMRPRLGAIPRGAAVVEPDAAPRLYALVNDVCARLGSRPVWRIVLEARYNAAFGAVGFRRRNVLFLGYPLWNVLTPQERIALLGHEIGHEVNGDLRRGLLVGLSLHSLAELPEVLRPHRSHIAGTTGLVWFGQAIARSVLWWLSWPLLGVILVHERLLAQSGQQAEYYADHLSATVAGVAATRSMLDKLRLGWPCLRTLHTAIIRRDKDIWASTRDWLATLPQAEQDTMIARAEVRPHRVAETHPTTRLRVDALGTRSYPPPTLTATDADARAIDDELRPLVRPVTERLRALAIG
jgi:Zn-dependent protease with chaperone function